MIGKSLFRLVADVGGVNADAVHVLLTIEHFDVDARLEERGAHAVVVVALAELRPRLETFFGLLQQIVDQLATATNHCPTEKKHPDGQSAVGAVALPDSVDGRFRAAREAVRIGVDCLGDAFPAFDRNVTPTLMS